MNDKPRLDPKPPRNDPGRRPSQALAKEALIDDHTAWFRRQSPPGEVIGASHPAHVNLDDKVTLLGYDLDRQVTRPGQQVQVIVFVAGYIVRAVGIGKKRDGVYVVPPRNTRRKSLDATIINAQRL